MLNKFAGHFTKTDPVLDWIRIRLQSVLRGRVRIRSKTGPDQQLRNSPLRKELV
jgi:hypothetical protein